MARNKVKTNTILHATAIDVGGNGAAIIGCSGSGKSSLAIKLMVIGASLVSDDQTLFSKIEGNIFLSKPRKVPNAIESRGLGLVPVPTIKASKLFCFIKLTNRPIERLPAVSHQLCLDEVVRLIHFNPFKGNVASLLLVLKYGLLDPTS